MALYAAPQAVDAPRDSEPLSRAGAIEYGPMRTAGAITDAQISESSGLAAARAPGNEGLLWTHNDSGDLPRLFLLSERGTLRATYRVDVPFATDWEDVCSFELDGVPYLLIGDVGDNGHQRQHVTLWLVPEPTFDPERKSDLPLKIKPTRKIEFTYAEGPQDCESIAFDPVRRAARRGGWRGGTCCRCRMRICPRRVWAPSCWTARPSSRSASPPRPTSHRMANAPSSPPTATPGNTSATTTNRGPKHLPAPANRSPWARAVRAKRSLTTPTAKLSCSPPRA